MKNLNVVPLKRELLQVFRDQYGFQTSSFEFPVIQNPNSHSALIWHLLDHADNFAADNKLRIYVHSGHSCDPGKRGLTWHLAYGRSEFVGAAGWDAHTVANHDLPFNRAFIDTLNEMSGQNSTLATGRLHGALDEEMYRLLLSMSANPIQKV
ncbi:hypothetical protein N7453_005444 [Penicillium expansum]|nr:hypothetical protein N7453_005444 [Penicillium expansum]